MLLHTLQTDRLTTEIYDSRSAMGAAAAARAAWAIRETLKTREFANVIFAAAPSQNETLEYLLKEDIDFSRINAFHMDEYMGLSADAPQSFASYLTEHIFGKAPFRSVHLIPAQLPLEEVCATYTQLLLDFPTDVVCMGIGENGHIAFNDPGVADFNDPEVIKVAELDLVCRTQQVHDGCFPTLDDVPTHALTLTCPTLMGAKYQFCVVPTTNKANAVKRMLTGEIDDECPATCLRRAEHATLYLDADSASLL